MKRLVIILLIVLGFNSYATGGGAEEVIRKDSNLSYLAKQMSKYYQEALAKSEDKSTLTKEQNAWLAHRDKQCPLTKKGKSIQNCLSHLYKTRNFTLFKKAYGNHEKPTTKLLQNLEFADFTAIGPLNKSQIQALSTVKINGEGQFPDGFKASEHDYAVSNCAEYEKYGIHAKTTYDISMESFFIQTCGILSLLKKAQIPKKSFINEHFIFDTEFIPVDILQGSMLFDKTDIAHFKKEKLSLSDLTHKGIISLKKKPYEINIIINQPKAEEIKLNAIAIADFTGEGIASVLVTRSDVLLIGSMRTYDVGLMRRLSNTDLFQYQRIS